MALALTTTATVFVIGLQAWRFRRALGPIVLSARPVYERRIWIKAALPLLLVSGFIVIIEQTDIVMVGAILGDRAAGLYGAAAKTASLVGLILIAVNTIGAPMFSVLFAQDRHKDLQQLVSAITAWAFWPSCLLSIILATCAPLVLTTFGRHLHLPSGSCASSSSARSSMPPLARSGGSYCYQAVRTWPPGSTDGLRLSTLFSLPS